MRVGRRMPEEAKAWGNAQDRLTSGRYSGRESHESEATCQDTGSVPDGGLARHSLEARAPACLPPPKTDLPSRQVCVTSTRTLRSGVPGNGHAPFWNSGRRGDPSTDCNGMWKLSTWSMQAGGPRPTPRGSSGCIRPRSGVCSRRIGSRRRPGLLRT